MTEAQRQAAILKTSKEQAAKARAENAAQRNGYKAASWMETAEPATVQMSEEEGESEEEVVIHECVACKKTFKTEAQYAAHERSKKHKQAVYQLKKKMEKEDRELGLEREGKETGEMEVAESESADEAAPDAEAVSDRLEDSELETVEPTSAERLSTSAIETTPVTVSDDDEDSEDINDDHVSISEFQSRVLGKDKDEELIAGMDKATLNGSEGEEDSTPPTPSGPKMGKAKLKREKKKAAAASTAAVLEVCVHMLFAHCLSNIHFPNTF